MAINNYTRKDVGFWFPRVERGAILADTLTRRGCSITLYHNQPIPRGTYSSKYADYNFFKGIRVLFRTNHDYYFSTGLLIPALQLVIYKWIRKKPFILGVGAPYWRTYNNNHHNIISRWVMHKVIYPGVFKLILYNANYTITNSIYLQELMVARYPAFSRKIKNIYNGVNYETFNSEKKRLSLIRGETLNIISIGTANFRAKTNGIIFLIVTVAEYIADNPKTNFTIAVKSVIQSEQKRLVAAIPKNVLDQITILFNSNQVTSLIEESDIFIYSTPNESSDSLPRVLIEAQAMGIPTITTNAVGCAEVIIDGKTGIVTKYDKTEILQAINFIQDNPAIAEAMATEGQKHVRRVFNWESMAQKYQKLFSN